MSPATALAEPPGNDDFDSAVVVSNLPFQAAMATNDATAATDDPTTCHNNGSVWFSFTPDHDVVVVADTFGSDYDTVLSAYTGSRGSLNPVPGGCSDDAGGTAQSRFQLTATAGTTYHFLAGRCCGNGGSGGGNLTFSLAELQSPANDEFAGATAISGLPFSRTADTQGATLEADEPRGACGTANGSVWYSFTPAETASVTPDLDYSSGYPMLTVYTGNSLNTLTEVVCGTYYSPLTFRAVAGQTYYFQLGTLYEPDQFRFGLDVAPAVNADFDFDPSDPSTFEQTRFYDRSNDPAGSSITTRQWQFGDGGSATGYNTSHRYATDGDYTTSLTVTTTDGRTATASQTVRVRTHDVAIDRLLVPASARAGQTRHISVAIRNGRYDDSVRVELYRSTPTGFVQVGSLTQLVLADPRQTTDFPFNYTFSPEDAALGKVTFKAVAVIVNARDALSSDNQVISTPTTVS